MLILSFCYVLISAKTSTEASTCALTAFPMSDRENIGKREKSDREVIVQKQAHRICAILPYCIGHGKTGTTEAHALSAVNLRLFSFGLFLFV